MKRYLAAAALALCACLAGCKSPKYALYTSPSRDFQCDVPWAWNVMYDSEGTHFEHLSFIGPFEPDFYLGAPSLSVRWYSRYATHRLRDGQLEMYIGPEDFINQTLLSVYGKEREMFRPVQDLAVNGRKLKYFVVVSAAPAAQGARWGTATDKDGRVINPRKHAYVVVPMPSGFYVLTYPATRQAYDAESKTRFERLKIYKDYFEQLVNSFVPLKDGPGGPVLPAASSGKPAK